MFLWVAIEILQIAVIGILAVGYRNLQRKVDGKYDFTSRTPRSVTEEYKPLTTKTRKARSWYRYLFVPSRLCG